MPDGLQRDVDRHLRAAMGPVGKYDRMLGYRITLPLAGMRDLGLDSQLSAIAGTSVGGLNGAMFAQGKFNQARDMWLNIESRNMLTVQDVPGLAAQLASMATGSVMAQAIRHSARPMTILIRRCRSMKGRMATSSFTATRVARSNRS